MRSAKPRLLDLFCGEGGAAMGYHRAGFDVFGVDMTGARLDHYPFPSVEADAIEFLLAEGNNFDVIHASPPCQHASAGTRAVDRSRYPRLIEPVREAARATGKPYVIENVAGSALLSPITLCGTMFGLTAYDEDETPLELWRHRNFESNVPLIENGPCQHHYFSEQVAGSYGGARRDKDEARYIRHGGYVPSKAVQERLLGIGWMTQYGLYQSVPPAYTRYIGGLIVSHLTKESAVA